MRKRVALCVIGVVILVFITLLVLLNLPHEQEVEETFITTLKVVDENNTSYELRVSQLDLYKYYFVDNEKVSQLTYSQTIGAKGIMSLPNESDEGYNLIGKEEPTSELTWSADLDTSIKYINYLKLSGYSDLRTIYTPTYVEKYLQKGSIIKRILILKDSIMVADVVTSFELPTVESYFEQ